MIIFPALSGVSPGAKAIIQQVGKKISVATKSLAHT